jgi:hypothetical protein
MRGRGAVKKGKEKTKFTYLSIAYTIVVGEFSNATTRSPTSCPKEFSSWISNILQLLSSCTAGKDEEVVRRTMHHKLRTCALYYGTNVLCSHKLTIIGSLFSSYSVSPSGSTASSILPPKPPPFTILDPISLYSSTSSSSRLQVCIHTRKGRDSKQRSTEGAHTLLLWGCI